MGEIFNRDCRQSLSMMLAAKMEEEKELQRVMSLKENSSFTCTSFEVYFFYKYHQKRVALLHFLQHNNCLSHVLTYRYEFWLNEQSHYYSVTLRFLFNQFTSSLLCLWIVFKEGRRKNYYRTVCIKNMFAENSYVYIWELTSDKKFFPSSWILISIESNCYFVCFNRLQRRELSKFRLMILYLSLSWSTRQKWELQR